MRICYQCKDHNKPNLLQGFVSIATSQDTWQGAAHNLLEELEGPLALDQEEMVKNKLMGRKEHLETKTFVYLCQLNCFYKYIASYIAMFMSSSEIYVQS